jgi:hypothetical protein
MAQQPAHRDHGGGTRGEQQQAPAQVGPVRRHHSQHNPQDRDVGPRTCRHPGTGRPGDSNRADPPADEREAAANALWLALCTAPEDGYEIAELIWLAGMTRVAC